MRRLLDDENWVEWSLNAFTGCPELMDDQFPSCEGCEGCEIWLRDLAAKDSITAKLDDEEIKAGRQRYEAGLEEMTGKVSEQSVSRLGIWSVRFNGRPASGGLVVTRHAAFVLEI